MSSQRNDEQWIRSEAIPSLVANGKLTFGPNAQPAVLRSVDATRLSMAESFMLTACYKVQVELAESTDANAATSLVKLVVKVSVCMLIKYNGLKSVNFSDCARRGSRNEKIL